MNAVKKDVDTVVRLVAELQSEAKAYASSGDNIYRCQRLADAAAELSEFMRLIRGRKPNKDE